MLQTSDVFMLMYFVGNHYSDQLCDSCKDQIGMESFSFWVLRLASPKLFLKWLMERSAVFLIL